MNTTATSISMAELTDQVVQALERAPRPLTVFQIQRSLPRSFQSRTDELRQCLREQVSQGRLHPFAPYRSKAPRFWTRDPEQHAREVIVEVLNEQALTRPELFLKIRRRLQGLPDGRLPQLLAEMLVAGQVRKLPPRIGGRANLLSTREPQPRDYLAPVFKTLAGTLREVFKRLESEGVSRESFQRQTDELWQAMAWDRPPEEPAPRRTGEWETPEMASTEEPASVMDPSQPETMPPGP